MKNKTQTYLQLKSELTNIPEISTVTDELLEAELQYAITNNSILKEGDPYVYKTKELLLNDSDDDQPTVIEKV